MKKNATKPIIYAYGFDKAGFITPSELLETKNYIIRFLGYAVEQSLEEADGIILPSGIFEEFKSESGYGGTSRWVECDTDHLAKREKEVFQNFNKGGWTAFLLRSVNNGRANEWQNEDLAKRFLNAFFWNIKRHDANPHVHCKADEFANYLHDFGINRTTFGNAKGKHNPRVLAGDAHDMVAAEILGKFFFLPLPSINKGRTEVISLVTKCADAILEYRRRNELYLPPWIESIEFDTEKRLSDEIKNLEDRVIQGREEMDKWRRFKGILSASGRPLNSLVVEVLRDFFGLNLQSEEAYIEDAIIFDDSNKPLFVVEIKGVNGGLKRDHVNQVDSHRERLSISAEIPGLLILNDFTDIDGLQPRMTKEFDPTHLAHAEKLNVKILRTTTLLEIMRSVEQTTERSKSFFELCLAGNPLVKVLAK